MNDDKLFPLIEELGLSNKEARIYVAALKLGPSAVQQIADRSGIKRVTTYVILESLLSLGLVSQSIRGRKTYFVAESPQNLERLLEKRQRELNEQNHSLKQILPHLEQLKSIPREMPEVKFYSGSEAVRSLFAVFFAEYRGTAKEIFAISNLDDASRFIPDVRMGKPNPHRIKHNVKSHIIYTTEKGPIYKDSDHQYNRTSRFVPKDQFPLTGDVYVFGDHVIMFSFHVDSPVAVAIKNTDLAHGMKAIFDMSWETAAQFN
jgi:sugar-specific transcriptional regulator TrmB